MPNSGVVDQKARDMAQAAHNSISSHEKECALRWNASMQTMGDIKRILAWGTAALFGSMCGLIGFLATHTITH